MEWDVLAVSILVFVIMETANVIILYFKPEFKYGNGVAVFKEWERSKEEENKFLFARYLVSWIAGVKLIFIFLLLAILIVGDETMKVVGVIAMIISISSYFIALHPIIKRLDKKGQITPEGYSKKLGAMIMSFLIMFSLALVLHFVLY